MDRPQMLSKQAIANFRRASMEQYRQELVSVEHRMTEVNSLVSGYSEGLRAMLQHLLDTHVVEWEPAPPIDSVVRCQVCGRELAVQGDNIVHISAGGYLYEDHKPITPKGIVG